MNIKTWGCINGRYRLIKIRRARMCQLFCITRNADFNCVPIRMANIGITRLTRVLWKCFMCPQNMVSERRQMSVVPSRLAVAACRVVPLVKKLTWQHELRRHDATRRDGRWHYATARRDRRRDVTTRWHDAMARRDGTWGRWGRWGKVGKGGERWGKVGEGGRWWGRWGRGAPSVYTRAWRTGSRMLARLKYKIIIVLPFMQPRPQGFRAVSV